MVWEWVTTNAEKIGAAVVALGGLLGVVWGKMQGLRVEKAKTGADVAIAESQREVFEQMKERLTSLDTTLTRMQEEVDALRAMLHTRDNKIHSLEMYVKDLQHVLHRHGIDVPPMRQD